VLGVASVPSFPADQVFQIIRDGFTLPVGVIR
jgi:hypothetical protein